MVAARAAATADILNEWSTAAAAASGEGGGGGACCRRCGGDPGGGGGFELDDWFGLVLLVDRCLR